MSRWDWPAIWAWVAIVIWLLAFWYAVVVIAIEVF